MKKIYSIGYLDYAGDFNKVRDEKGYTAKFATIEEAKKYMEEYIKLNKQYMKNEEFKIMQGWKVVEEVK